MIRMNIMRKFLTHDIHPYHPLYLLSFSLLPTYRRTNSTMEKPPPPDGTAPPPVAKKAKKQVEKPLPPFLQTLNILSMPDYEVTSTRKKIKNDDGVEEELEVAESIIKGDDKCRLEKELTALQLRKIAKNLGVTKGSLSKGQCCYWILRSKGDQGIIQRDARKLPATHCRIINVWFHRNYVEDFLAFNDARSRTTQETGPGSSYERFWKSVVNAVNGAETTPQKQQQQSSSSRETILVREEDTLAELPDSQPIEAADSERRILDFGLDDSPEDPYKDLLLKEDIEENNTYNGHITDAKQEGMVPTIENCVKITSSDVTMLFKALLNIRKLISTAMKASGSHDSDPMAFVDQALYKATTKVHRFVAFYFFTRAEMVQGFAHTFTTSLPESLRAESTRSLGTISSTGKSGKKSRSSTPNSQTTKSLEGTTAVAMQQSVKVAMDQMTTESLQRQYEQVQRLMVAAEGRMKRKFAKKLEKLAEKLDLPADSESSSSTSSKESN